MGSDIKKVNDVIVEIKKEIREILSSKEVDAQLRNILDRIYVINAFDIDEIYLHEVIDELQKYEEKKNE